MYPSSRTSSSLLCTLGAVVVAGAALAPRADAQCNSGSMLLTKGLKSDHFGEYVAMDGERCIISSPDSDTLGGASGSADIFKRNASGQWSFEQRIFGSTTTSSDSFGEAVDMDGNLAIVGAPNDDPAGASAGGRAFIFERINGTWTEVALLEASDAGSSDNFGTAVAIQGDRALVGAPRWDGTLSDQGTVYVFERSGGTWSAKGRIDGVGIAQSTRFGAEVKMDGDTVVVRPESKNDAYVFIKVGLLWLQQQKITFSSQVKGIDIEGNRLVIGVPNNFSPSPGGGRVFVYERTGSIWSEVDSFTADGQTGAPQFGSQVALDGDRIAVASIGYAESPNFSLGRGYVFELSGGSWTQAAVLSPCTPSNSLQFAKDIAISGDHVLAGVLNDDFLDQDAGAAEAFRRQGGNWNRSDYFFGGFRMSATSGGDATMLIQSGPSNSGFLYAVLGSVTGTSPGIQLGNQNIPLNFDGWTEFTLVAPNAPPLSNSIGLLGPNGEGQAGFTVPAGLPANWVGLEFSHAAIALDIFTTFSITHITEAETFTVRP